MCSDEDSLNFKCEACGSKELALFGKFVREYDYKETIPCRCGKCSVAASRRVIATATIECDGELDADHSFSWDDSEAVDLDRDEGEWIVECQRCFHCRAILAPAQGLNEDFTEREATITVRCAGCDREVEFGWDFGRRRGGIWPVESEDFDPSKVTPEPRHRHLWEERGGSSRPTRRTDRNKGRRSGDASGMPPSPPSPSAARPEPPAPSGPLT